MLKLEALQAQGQGRRNPKAAVLNDLMGVVTLLQTSMNRRFPVGGCNNFDYAVAHFIHPYWKGAVLKKFGKLDDIKQRLITEHPTTAQFANESKEKKEREQQQPTEENEALHQLLAEQEQEQESSQENDGDPPMKLEIAMFMKMAKPKEGVNVDVLKWWRGSKNQFPNLYQVARYTFFISYQ